MAYPVSMEGSYMSIVWGKLNVNLAEHQECYEEAKRRLGLSNSREMGGVLSIDQVRAAVQLAERIRREREAKWYRD
jgi:predicted DNA-binding WGR domain protein